MRPPHVLIIVQNLPVPLDRRVWLECNALKARGYDVSVICPKGPGDPRFQEIDGIKIYKYRPAPEAQNVGGFIWEFAYSWVRTAVLSVKAWRRNRFDVIQACNPPDTYWLLARLWRLAGVRFIFDHHDLNPELFLSRFGAPKGVAAKAQYAALCWLERRTFRAADRVISTNESYKAIAERRGGLDPEHVTVVRSGPDTQTMRPIFPTHPKADGEIELVYLGIMGPQDGVDQVLLVMDELVHRRGRAEVRATLLGFGDCLEDLKAQCLDLGLSGQVTFTGRVDRVAIAEYLSRADIGVCPDLKTPLNDLSTMNKTMEYMCYALPAVSFDLDETKVSGGDTVRYVSSGDIAGFADEIERLIDDPKLRVEMGRQARERVSTQLDWRPQAEAYVGVFDELCGHHSPGPAVPDHPGDGLTDAEGRRYVDLRDTDALERFIVERKAP